MYFWGSKRHNLVILAIIGTLIISILGLTMYYSRKNYEERSVMAKKYLDAGKYEDAIDTYEKVISMNQGNQELLSVGLAEAYCGIYEYDKALEVLRNYYTTNNSNTVKVKIEEISTRKTNFIFEQTISKADTYFSNGEYEKAITEYDKAKSIKSKEAISYERIAESYMAMNKYDLARNVADSGLVITKDVNLERILDKIDAYLLEGEYNTLIDSAAEFIAQENYEEAILIYEKAIGLLPKKDTAYQKLSEVYVLQTDYDKAIDIVQGALNIFKSDVLEEIHNKVQNLKDESNKRQTILTELYTAVINADVDKILNILDSNFYKNKISSLDIITFSTENQGTHLIIYNDTYIYAGGMEADMKKGMGTSFTRYQGGWYYYKGEWSNDLPNGMGVAKEKIEHANGTDIMVITQGTFLYGLENAQMQKTFYENSTEIGTILYRAKNGVPQPMINDQGLQMIDGNEFIIAYWIRDGIETEEYYKVDSDTKWSVLYTKN